MSVIDLPQTSAPALPATLRLGAVDLTVRELDRSVAWYQRALGLRVHEHEADTAVLGDGIEAVVVLHEDPAAQPKGGNAGLFHFALLYPSREELARTVARLAATQTPIEGVSDHGTHEAIYLPDLDGNGIELAWDREPELWPDTPGRPDPLDFASLLGTIAGEQPADHVGEGLRVGHLHLHVGDIKQALAFYGDVLGFEVQGDWGTAAFVSAGGYHHHLGLNVWNGRAIDGPPPHTVGLRHWTVQLPTVADVDALRERIETHNHGVSEVAAGFDVPDPWGTVLRVVATSVTGLHARAIVATEKPSPYLKQLAKHFRHKLAVRFDDLEAVIPLPTGHAEVHADGNELTMDVYAQTPANLQRVQHVIGSHLERFGRRDELSVTWTEIDR